MDKRLLSDSEKEEILKYHGRVCFITGHAIDEEEEVQFHHIKPYTEGGSTTKDNIAPVCKEHHKHIGTMSLQEYRDKLYLENFFREPGERKLDDVLNKKVGSFGQKVIYSISEDGSQINITFSDGLNRTIPLHKCQATNSKFFYSMVPAKNVRNDSELQPRPLEAKRMWELYRHLQLNTQLAASVCRMMKSQILLFDGQHKAASQLWLGRDLIECKVYIEPDAKKLKETNLTAHEKLRQMPFYTSTLIRKYSDIFGDDWEEYLGSTGVKSEKDFVRFLVTHKDKKKAEATKEIKMALIKDILECDSPENKIVEYIAEENRSRKNPLTYSVLQKTFFNDFLSAPPLEVEFESPADFRKNERLNLVKLFNIIADETLIGQWNPELNDSTHKRTERIYLSGAIRAWVPMLKDAIAQILRLFESDEKENIFFRDISDKDFDIIHGRVKQLFSHKIWDDPKSEIDSMLKINEPATTKKYLKDYGLDVSWILGGET